jgi:hypothetical protein
LNSANDKRFIAVSMSVSFLSLRSRLKQGGGKRASHSEAKSSK